MCQIGELVVYGIHGICRVADQEIQTVDGQQKIFLVLEPVDQEGSRYLVPVQNQKAMSKIRPVLSREEMQALLSSEEVRKDDWIRDENARKQRYRSLITGCDLTGLARMVYTLYRHQQSQQQLGKKVHMADENFLRDAEKLLTGELALVMVLSSEEARAYLRKKLGNE